MPGSPQFNASRAYRRELFLHFFHRRAAEIRRPIEFTESSAATD